MATIAAPPVTKTTLDVLRDARALYSERPSHAAANDMPCPGTYCVITALSTAAGENTVVVADLYWDAESAFMAPLGRVLSLPGWNAEHTTEEVLAVFDRAIAALEAEGA